MILHCRDGTRFPLRRGGPASPLGPRPACYDSDERKRVQSLFSLMYASTAAKAFSQQELLDLLSQSRVYNAAHDITGLLLYSPGSGGLNGTFVQVLEGPRVLVQGLYVRISRDPRHSECALLQQGEALTRRFADWTMGFRDLSTAEAETVLGFNRVFFQNWTIRDVVAEKDPVLQLLYSFAGV